MTVSILNFPPSSELKRSFDKGEIKALPLAVVRSIPKKRISRRNRVRSSTTTKKDGR